MSLIYPGKQSVKITKIDVTQQQGHDDCGLFAIAFAQSLCEYAEPGCVEYVQASMRDAFDRFLHRATLRFECKRSNALQRTALCCELDLTKKLE